MASRTLHIAAWRFTHRRVRYRPAGIHDRPEPRTAVSPGGHSRDNRGLGAWRQTGAGRCGPRPSRTHGRVATARAGNAPGHQAIAQQLPEWNLPGRSVKPPRTTGARGPWTDRMKPRDWLDLVVGVLMLVIAFLGVTRLLPMPWWFVLSMSLGSVFLVGGVAVRVRNR